MNTRNFNITNTENQRKISREDYETELTFEKLRRKNANKLLRRRISYAVIIFLLAAAFVIASIYMFFRVKNIEITGNDCYENEEIIKGSGIDYDMNIYLIKDNLVKSNIVSRFPLIKTVKINRNIPTTISLNLECDEPMAYIEITGEYFVVSKEMRILERSFDKEAILTKYPSLKKLVAPIVKSAIIGNNIEFINSDYIKVGRELFEVLKESEIFAGLTTIDISDKFNINVIYDKRIKSNLGDLTEINVKLKFLYNIIVKELTDKKGTVDVSGVEMGYFIPNNQAIYD